MNNIFNTLLVTVVTVLSGCATPASQNAMAIGMQDIPAKLNPGLKEQVNIRNVTGGKETNPFWTPQVDNAGFKGALDQSLIAIGYKSKSAADAKMQIDASLQNVRRHRV